MGWVCPCQHRLWSDTIQTQGYNSSRANVFCLRLGGRGEAYGVTRLGRPSPLGLIRRGWVRSCAQCEWDHRTFKADLRIEVARRDTAGGLLSWVGMAVSDLTEHWSG